MHLEKVFVYGIDDNASSAFAVQLNKELGLVARAGKKVDSKDADIICTATNSKLPVFDAVDVKKGCHINAISFVQTRNAGVA